MRNRTGSSVFGGIFLIIFGLSFLLTSLSFVELSPKSEFENIINEINSEEGIFIDEDTFVIMGEAMDDDMGFGVSSGFTIFNIISYIFIAVGVIITIIGIVSVAKAVKNKGNMNNYEQISYTEPDYSQMDGQYMHNAQPMQSIQPMQSMQPMDNIQPSTYVLNGVTYNRNGERVDN